MSTSFITPGHVRAFQAVTTQIYGEVTLASCRINGEPGVTIVLVEHIGEGKVAVMPLFVAITPNMEISFEGDLHVRRNGDEQGHDGDFALADMLDEDNGDAGFTVDEATGEGDLAIELRRYGLEGTDVTGCDERGAHGAPPFTTSCASIFSTMRSALLAASI